ncbi:amidohydrolase [Dictyobacter alpinus]|uniref:Amidohydrolase n=1 Tax=Dictyobacter alpinus TaxID=2014873 RepID=A0A402BDT6_9CHLR|nr:amidohydrolase family protein [Dictyobacter alpinus]GCE29553.1 amidohydrolase [Dictyobacter alpinus]
MSKKIDLLIDADIHPVLNTKRIQHFLPEPWRTRLADGNRGPGGLGYWNPNGVMRKDAVIADGTRIESSAEHLAQHFLDAYQIDYGVLNPSNSLSIGTSPELDYAAALLAATNDVIVHDWLPVDTRLRASLLVSPGDPLLAAKEIHRLGDHPGLVQILMPSASRIAYGNRFFYPIYEAAVAHQLPIAIHPGAEGSGMSAPPTAVGYPSNYFEWHTGLVGGYIAHLISLIAEGVFVRFPSLKFVLIEGGVSWLPAILWRLDKNWKALRMTMPWLDRLPSDIIREHVLLTTQPLEEPEHPGHLTAIFEMFAVSQMLMFSSDFPHWDSDMPDFAGRVFPAAVRPRIMGQTASELYGLGALHD